MTTHKQITDVADKMAKALQKLTDGLAQDGTALEGFVDAINVQQEWSDIRFKRNLELYLRRAGVVENFAHELPKELQTEALNKHNVMGRSELLLAFCAYLEKEGAAFPFDKQYLIDEFLKASNSP